MEMVITGAVPMQALCEHVCKLQYELSTERDWVMKNLSQVFHEISCIFKDLPIIAKLPNSGIHSVANSADSNSVQMAELLTGYSVVAYWLSHTPISSYDQFYQWFIAKTVV